MQSTLAHSPVSAQTGPGCGCASMSPLLYIFSEMEILQIALKAVLPIQEGSADPQATETTASILENVIATSKALLNHGKLSSHETTQSLQMVELHLTAIAHCSHPSESPLPDKEDIPPNESTRMKTAKQMGAKQQWRKPHPATTSPLEPLAMHQIRELIHKKAPVKITDPCSSGVSSSQTLYQMHKPWPRTLKHVQLLPMAWFSLSLRNVAASVQELLLCPLNVLKSECVSFMWQRGGSLLGER